MSSSSLALLPWSYSKLTTSERCPYSIELLYGERRTQLQKINTAAQQEGLDTHKHIENFLKYNTPIPIELHKPFATNLAALKEQGAKSEFKLHIGKNWTPEKGWGIAILDILLRTPDHITIIDLKNGKFNLSHVDQQMCYTLFVKTHYPTIPIHNEIWYTTENKIKHFDFDQTTLEGYQHRLEARINILENSEFRPPKPSKWNCLYCPAKSICDYNAS